MRTHEINRHDVHRVTVEGETVIVPRWWWCTDIQTARGFGWTTDNRLYEILADVSTVTLARMIPQAADGNQLLEDLRRELRQAAGWVAQTHVHLLDQIDTPILGEVRDVMSIQPVLPDYELAGPFPEPNKGMPGTEFYIRTGA